LFQGPQTNRYAIGTNKTADKSEMNDSINQRWDQIDSEDTEKAVVTMQIIATALIGGLVIAGAIVLLLALGRNQQAQPGLRVFSYITVVISVVNILLSIFVPNLFANAAVKNAELASGKSGSARGDDIGKQILKIAQARMIVGLALLEGAAFLCLLAFYLTKSWMLMGVFLLLLVIMAAQFPMRDKLENWLDAKRNVASR
jgi:hypothetical protein